MCHAACGLGSEQHTFTSPSFLWPKQVIWPRPKSRVEDLAVEKFYHGKERKEQFEGKEYSLLWLKRISPQQCDSIAEC